MNDKMLLSSLLCGLFTVSCAQNVTRQFHFVNLNLKWSEARQYCRQHYTDLATVTKTEEMNKLLRPASYSGDAWIGLYNIAVTYDNWNGGAPSNNDACTGIYYWGKWFHYVCTTPFYSVCYKEGKTFIPVSYLLSWDKARAYCRANYTDLALIESETENSLVVSMILSHNTSADKIYWIGWDTRTGWRWSDGSRPDFTHWMGGRPLEVTSSICIAEDQNHYWKDQSCDQTLPFFFYKDPLKHTFVRMSFSSSLDLSDADNYRTAVQMITDKLDLKGFSSVNVTWKSPPKKTTKTSLDDVKCPQTVV